MPPLGQRRGEAGEKLLIGHSCLPSLDCRAAKHEAAPPRRPSARAAYGAGEPEGGSADGRDPPARRHRGRGPAGDACALRGIDYLFANAGTDFAPLIEGLARAPEPGSPCRRRSSSRTRSAAIAMAHGYWLTTGRPQAVMVHVNVGLANTLMGVINAARDNVPLLLLSGRTPARRGRPDRRARPADPLGPGDARPGRHAARAGEVGLRAAAARAGAAS